MNYDAIFLVYLGSVGSIFLLNAVQWGLSRDLIYGLFTFQTLLWLTNAAVIGLDLTDQERDVIYGVTMGLVRISYIELIDRLFKLAQTHPRLRRWFRTSQWMLIIFVVIDLVIFLTHSDRQHSPLLWVTAIVYSGFAVVTCVAGMWIVAHRQDLVSRFFMLGSFFMFLDEGRALLSFSNLLWEPSTGPSADTFQWLANTVGTIFILQLLSFSLCLVFRQRQLAVAQTREEEQLVQDRLAAELTVRRLEQEKTDVQLRALQAQVNPHFLFNSLNSLSSLIDEEPERAGQFVNELSVVYRYLLRANRATGIAPAHQPEQDREQLLTSLSRELKFIQSYYHLLKIRYGNGLTLTIRVDDRYHNQLLPPLTLQLLVENAVKHNVTSDKRPLSIIIFSDESGHLIVQNNLQRKTTRVLSNSVGLSTIAMQYQQLNQPPPVVADENEKFTVTLLLIVPSADLTPVFEETDSTTT